MTNRELAKQLGISPAAFSLIINNKPGISDQTRQRVISQLEEMGLSHLIKPEEPEDIPEVPEQPVSAAPVYKGSICFAIYKRNGVVMGHHPFFLLLMEIIENRARKYGYTVMLKTLDHASDMQEQVFQLNHSDLKGVLIMATEMDAQDLAYFRDLTVPCVFLDNDFSFDCVNSVSINNQMGTWQAVSYLAEMGHKNIGYVKSTDRISSWDERTEGFHQAAERLGITLNPNHIYRVRYNEEGSYRDMMDLLKGHPSLPSALVFEDDVIAVGVCRALNECGYRVPEDVSLVGFNNRPICEMTQPKLTSVDVPKQAFGTAGIDVLVSLIDDQTEDYDLSAKHRVNTRLAVRDSVARRTE